MTTRRTLIIGNPGETGASNYCSGVDKDLENYRDYLTSDLGGGWYSHEVLTLRRPTLADTKSQIATLGNYGYSMVIFCGHGYYSAPRSQTVVELRHGHEISETELKAGSAKRTVILDCCRKVEVEQVMLKAAMDSIALAEARSVSNARFYYEKAIDSAPPGVVTMYGCDIDETAGDDSRRGGYFSVSLLEGAAAWRTTTKFDLQNNYYNYDVAAAHAKAVPGTIRMSVNKQHPQIAKPRSDPYFPFAIAG